MSEQTVRLLEDFSQTGVYQILNTVNGKRYVGSAACFRKRWAVHRANLRKGSHRNRLLQNSWNKHGETAFAFMVIEYCHRSSCVPTEQKHIDGLRAAESSCGYNLRAVAASNLGFKNKPDAILRMSAAKKKNYEDNEEYRRKLSVAGKGRKASDLSRQRMSQSQKGKTRSPESIAKRAETMKGLYIDPEYKARMSKCHTGKTATEETRKKISLSNKGRVVSVATRKKISAARTGSKASDETKRKLSAARKGRPKSRQHVINQANSRRANKRKRNNIASQRVLFT